MTEYGSLGQQRPGLKPATQSRQGPRRNQPEGMQRPVAQVKEGGDQHDYPSPQLKISRLGNQRRS